MINNKKNFVKIGIIFFVIIFFGLWIIWLIDQGFNGVIKEWFYKLFLIEPNYGEDGKVGVIFSNWSDIKLFFIYVFIACIILLALCICISIYLYGHYRSKKEYSMLTYIMNSLMSDKEDITLPKKYAEVETQIIRIKAAAQKQQQLMQAQMQQKNDLITYLAHDLKTPLASVIGYLSLLDEARDMPLEQKAKYTGIALEKAYRLEELINEFFDITRFNLQSIVLNKGKIKLTFMLQQLADEFYPLLAPQGKQVSIEAPEDLILVGDADKLARVFNNILKNAIAYSYKNSIITIKAEYQADKVVITFINQGDPIPAQKLDTIFEKFYRLDSARSTNTGGAGLGLAIAQEIVKAHGGIITVESNLENTKFTIQLPS